MLDELKFHDGCDDMYCRQCQANNKVLEDILYGALNNRMDWLGRYHGWLREQGIEPETEGGWWTRETLNDANVQRFISLYGDDA